MIPTPHEYNNCYLLTFIDLNSSFHSTLLDAVDIRGNCSFDDDPGFNNIPWRMVKHLFGICNKKDSPAPNHNWKRIALTLTAHAVVDVTKDQ